MALECSCLRFSFSCRRLQGEHVVEDLIVQLRVRAHVRVSACVSLRTCLGTLGGRHRVRVSLGEGGAGGGWAAVGQTCHPPQFLINFYSPPRATTRRCGRRPTAARRGRDARGDENPRLSLPSSLPSFLPFARSGQGRAGGREPVRVHDAAPHG